MPNPHRLPPRCVEHPRHHPGCGTCRAYSRRVRQVRLHQRSYGTWQPWGDLPTVQAHVNRLLEQGMSRRAIARRAGVSVRTVTAVIGGANLRVSRHIGEYLLGVRYTPSQWVAAVGVTRMLQALAVLGYGRRRLARQLGVTDLAVYHWQRGKRSRVSIHTHRAVETLYDQLVDYDGPSQVAVQAAVARGWHGPGAWTPETINDPDALPHTTDSYIDWAKLDRVKKKQVPFLELSWAEQLLLWRQHVGVGQSLRSFRDRYRPVPIELIRRLQEFS